MSCVSAFDQQACVPFSGDVADHAILLCSLLLGFNLDAYVVVGTAIDSVGQEMYYCWVMTRGATESGRPRVVFWESETGRRCAPDSTTMHGLRFCRVRWSMECGLSSVCEGSFTCCCCVFACCRWGVSSTIKGSMVTSRRRMPLHLACLI